MGFGFQPNLFVFPVKGIWFLRKNLKGGFVLTRVVLREGESQQQLLRRFRNKTIRSGLMSEVRKRRWFVSRSEQRRIDEKKAIRRIRKRERKKQEYGN